MTTVPNDLTQFANGDQVVVISMDGNLRVVAKGLGLGVPFLGGKHGGLLGGWQGFRGKGSSEGGFGMPRGMAAGGL